MVNYLYQVIVEFKVVDISTIDPLTNQLVKFQAKNTYWPTRIILGCETISIHTNHINQI